MLLITLIANRRIPQKVKIEESAIGKIARVQKIFHATTIPS